MSSLVSEPPHSLISFLLYRILYIHVCKNVAVLRKPTNVVTFSYGVYILLSCNLDRNNEHFFKY